MQKFRVHQVFISYCCVMDCTHSDTVENVECEVKRRENTLFM